MEVAHSSCFLLHLCNFYVLGLVRLSVNTDPNFLITALTMNTLFSSTDKKTINQKPKLNFSPTKASSLEMLSPIMVDRRWPTCISLAIFGEDMSTHTFFFRPTAGGTTPSLTNREMSGWTKAFFRWMLINPGPAISSCNFIECSLRSKSVKHRCSHI